MTKLPSTRWLGKAGGGVAVVLERHHLPRIRLVEQLAQQQVVHGVAGAKGAVGGQQRLANQIQVAHGVENFVLYKLVVLAQAIGIEHFVVVHDDGVIEPAAQRQAVGTHHFNVFGKAKGARPGNVAAVVASA